MSCLVPAWSRMPRRAFSSWLSQCRDHTIPYTIPHVSSSVCLLEGKSKLLFGIVLLSERKINIFEVYVYEIWMQVCLKYWRLNNPPFGIGWFSKRKLDTKAFKQFVWEATCWCTFETPKKDSTQRSSNNFSSSGQCNLQLSVGLWPLRELFILLALGQKKCNARYWKGWGLSAKLGKHCAIWGKLGTALQAYALNPCTKFPPNPTSRKVNT